MSKADKLLKRVEFYEKMASAQKPEAGDLLNKASLFERLALYSDGKSFLKAIAQQPPIGEGETPADPNLRPYGGHGEAGKSWEEERQREFGNARTIPPPPPLPPQDPGVGEPPMVFDNPTDRITGLRPIDPKVQEHLSSLITNRAWGVPLSPVNGKTPFDGRIGKETRRALDTFKSRMGLPANTPDAQVFQKIESEYAKDNPASYDFSSQLQQQEQNRIRESTPPGIGVNAPKKT